MKKNIKFTVATFADLVFEADKQGDEVASELLDIAATEVVLGIEALERVVGSSSDNCSLILTGSLLTAQNNLRERVIEKHGLSSRFSISVLGSMDLLQTTAKLVGINDVVIRELRQNPIIPTYFWKGGAK